MKVDRRGWQFGGLAVALALLGSLGNGGCAAKTEASAARWVALNEDCTNFFSWHYRAQPRRELTRESIREYAAQYLKGPVTHYFVNPTTGLVAPFDSKYMDCMWRLHDQRGCDCRDFQHYWMSSVRQLAERGLDAYAELMAAARERGVRVWVSMRMNDNHFVKEPDRCAISDLQRTRRELTREPNRKLESGVGAWHYALDYAQPEVRAANLQVVRELAERYEAEGLELDFTRHQFFFRPGREREDAPRMTEFLRAARSLALSAARSRGRRDYGIAVRVPTTPRLALAHGLAVADWIREGLVEVVIPANELNMHDYDLPVGEWQVLAAEAPHPVRIVPSCDSRVMLESRNESSRRLSTAAEYRGWMDNLFARGAKDVYFFNHYMIERLSPTCRAEVGLGEDPQGLDPERIGAQSRAYPVSHRDYWQLEGAGFDMSARQLPLRLERPQTVRIFVGSLGSARQVSLKLGFDGRPAAVLADGVRLNGVPPTAMRVEPVAPDWPGGRAETAWVLTGEFPVRAVKAGDNVISLGGAGAAVRLLAGELFLE